MWVVLCDKFNFCLHLLFWSPQVTRRSVLYCRTVTDEDIFIFMWLVQDASVCFAQCEAHYILSQWGSAAVRRCIWCYSRAKYCKNESHFECDRWRIRAKFVNTLLHANTIGAFGLDSPWPLFSSNAFWLFLLTLFALHQWSERCSAHVINGISRPWTVDGEKHGIVKGIARKSTIVMQVLQVDGKYSQSKHHACIVSSSETTIWRASVSSRHQWRIKTKILLFLLTSAAKLAHGHTVRVWIIACRAVR